MEQRIADVDFAYFPSPAAWEDQVLYFLVVDRFSDGRETNYLDNFGQLVLAGETPLYHPSDRGNATTTEADRQRWTDAGGKLCGGTLKGIEARLGYLKRLGVTAVWLSPIFETGSLLEIESHFGTRDDLVSMVRAAHSHGIRVILDVPGNHTGSWDACKALQSWIAFADLDGFRIETDEHRIPLREFAQSLGKENLCLLDAQAHKDPRGGLAALAALVTQAGTAFLYYGDEQLFEGHGEAMFGGEFGPFESRGRHCFDETAFVYRELSKILRLRRQNLAMRRGRQFLREISGDGLNFGLPRRLGGVMRSVVPWSRIFNDSEVLLAVNTDSDNPCTAWVTIDAQLHAAGTHFTYLYSTDGSQTGMTTAIESRNGRAVQVTLPPAGFAILA